MNIQEFIQNKIQDKIRKPPEFSLSDMFLKSYPPHSRFAESYRTLRTNINFSSIDKEIKSILVTSSAEKEGKTTTAANIGYTFAQTGRSVLMIDADLRKPTLSNLSPNKHTPGLSGILSDIFGTEVRKGSLEDFGISDIFRLLEFQKKTGVLSLDNGEHKINIYFQNGSLIDVNWLSRPEERRLVALLIKNGLITTEQAEEALTRKQSTGQKIGFVLIRMGLIKKEDLAGFISLHMIEGLRTALHLKTGTFSFERLPESYFDTPSFNPTDLAEVYNQVVIGEEELPFLQKKINTLIQDTGVENLSILPSGPLPPKPAEIIGSDRMSFLLSFFKRRYDMLIIDTPPILPATDALLLASQTDGVVLVTKANATDRRMVKKVVDQIRNAQANLIGIVLNQVDIKKEGYYKYYSKYYSKYYGENP